jgi:hypothetical protein
MATATKTAPDPGSRTGPAADVRVPLRRDVSGEDSNAQRWLDAGGSVSERGSGEMTGAAAHAATCPECGQPLQPSGLDDAAGFRVYKLEDVPHLIPPAVGGSRSR